MAAHELTDTETVKSLSLSNAARAPIGGEPPFTQAVTAVYPEITGDVLYNPHIGFVEATALSDASQGIRTVHGEAVEPYRIAGSTHVWNHPDSRVAFVGIRWRDIERVEGACDWSVLDRRLEEAHQRGCVSVVRLSPYALGDDDVPAWLRAECPERPEFPFWQVDPVTSRYVPCWTAFITAFARRYDGHPLISSVDLAIVGAWGEGGGTELLEPEVVRTIVSAYLDNFRETPVCALLHDPISLELIRSHDKPVGFRVDCLGDMGGFHGTEWSHMLDFYPQNIVNFGMKDAWRRGPVLFEACWHMEDWYRNGWDIGYIIDESLRWHISSYNGKGTTVPEAWKPEVERWLRRMGYRFELRCARWDAVARAGGALTIETLWVNSGVAPIYHRYPLVFRIDGRLLESACDITAWMPEEDTLVRDAFVLPASLAAGSYRLSVAITTGTVAPGTLALPLPNRGADGFYELGEVVIA